MENGKVKIPKKVFDQLTEVQHDGRCNMLDVNGVQRAAMDMECYELVNWIQEHDTEAWGKVVFGMVEVIEDSS